VEVRTGSGIYVQPPKQRNGNGNGTGSPRAIASHEAEGTEWGPLQLMQARRLVEAEVAALAARHARRPQVAVIASALAQMREEAGSGVEPSGGDEAFHTAVAQACGNEVLADTVRSYWSARHGPLFLRLGEHFENPASWSAALVEHAAVLEAIRAREPAAARAAMQQHLKKSTGRYSANWRRANHS
jgi:DNA-binding FadR family transcriptional regulator